MSGYGLEFMHFLFFYQNTRKISDIFYFKNMNYNFENLKNYALWYYFRYFPSSKKLLEKLNEKSKNNELSLKVFENISHLVNDKQVV